MFLYPYQNLAVGDATMCVCKKCMMIGGAVFLVLGVVFLLQDLGKWDFLGINWYTALFIVVGIGHLGSSHCADCEAARTGKAGKK